MHSFKLNNRKNKDAFIKLLVQGMSENSITSAQSKHDADHLITFTGLTVAKDSKSPVVVVGNDTDLLVILVDQSTKEM